jgi:hypothetical protein
MLGQDIDDVQMSLMKFFEMLKEGGLGHNSARTQVSAVRGFYTHNGIGFPKGYKLPLRKASAVLKVDNSTDVYDYENNSLTPD